MQQRTGFHFENTYLSLPSPFYSVDSPTGFKAPQVVLLNSDLVTSLGLDFSDLSEDEQAALFSGALIPDGTAPFSQAYAGHQFGNFTNLGDGRAHMLGEHVTPDGERFDIQFKGSGRTRYSRGGDGFAAIGPMCREYIISEAMHGLGIPTTRSLAVVTTGESVQRDRPLAGSVLTRVASSHIRVGTFEYAAAMQNPELLLSLVNYTIERHFPEFKESDTKALALLESVIQRQIYLIVHWMRVGFIHGVMNTDNMVLCGESIDFGPCAFMDTYNPDQVFSSIDKQGRYAYSNQPSIALWNLARLAEALLPLIDDEQEKAVEMAQSLLSQFEDQYAKQWLAMMRQKLGLCTSGDAEEDRNLIDELLNWMHQNGADFTNTFRDLSQNEAPTADHYDNDAFTAWYERYTKRRRAHGQTLESSIEMMRLTNPVVIPRNHFVERALADVNEGNLTTMLALLAALKNPYDYSLESTKFQTPPEPSSQPYQTFCGT